MEPGVYNGAKKASYVLNEDFMLESYVDLLILLLPYLLRLQGDNAKKTWQGQLYTANGASLGSYLVKNW